LADVDAASSPDAAAVWLLAALARRGVADQRVRRFGSHHQKLLVVHRPNDPDRCIAFVGGIDLDD
jgi:hypothetical protein